MKIGLKTSRMAVGVIMSLCAMAVSTTASAKNPKEVSMRIINDKLEITSSASENDCPWYEVRDPGCIKIKKNEKSEIWFHLTGDTKCNHRDGTSWELNKVFLGGFNSLEKPDSFGFANEDPADFDKVNVDFNGVDVKTGEVTLTEQKKNKLAINNINKSKYTVWYQIEAICPRTDGREAYKTTTDPRIKNGGLE